MASEKQRKLADFIKETHIKLRKDSRLFGAKEAWERHLARTKVLKNYATAMQELATEHWDMERLADNSAHCRNKWIRSQCYEYFFNKGREKFDKREMDIKDKMIASENNSTNVNNLLTDDKLTDDCQIHDEQSQNRNETIATKNDAINSSNSINEKLADNCKSIIAEKSSDSDIHEEKSQIKTKNPTPEKNASNSNSSINDKKLVKNRKIQEQNLETSNNEIAPQNDDNLLNSNKLLVEEKSVSDFDIEKSMNNFDIEKSKIRLLDVGSCYNPLGEEKMFRVTPIDLAPHSDNVFQCDFLNVKIGTKSIVSRDGKAIKQLKEESFDAVVFSLLLEYLPSPEQRFLCCEKAYKLLKPSGIILIITPDSNHVGKNAKFMESWRLVLSRLGFMRIVYEKSRHLHCLGFRKCIDKNVAARWSKLKIIPENDILLQAINAIYIPQDFQNFNDDEEICENCDAYDENELISLFGELPSISDDSSE